MVVEADQFVHHVRETTSLVAHHLESSCYVAIVSKRNVSEDAVISLKRLSMTGRFLVHSRQNSLVRHNGSVNIPSIF